MKKDQWNRNLVRQLVGRVAVPGLVFLEQLNQPWRHVFPLKTRSAKAGDSCTTS
jgi:hypothetical protein